MTKPLLPKLRRRPNRMNSPVVAVKPNGEVVAVYDNPSQAIRLAGICDSALYQCLLHKKKTANGYMWYYKDEHMKLWFENPDSLKWERNPNYSYFKRGRRKGAVAINKGMKLQLTSKELAQRREAACKAHDKMRREGTYQKLAQKRCKRIVSCDTGTVYDSISKRAKQIGVRIGTLSMAIQKRYRCKGEYYEYCK